MEGKTSQSSPDTHSKLWDYLCCGQFFFESSFNTLEVTVHCAGGVGDPSFGPPEDELSSHLGCVGQPQCICGFDLEVADSFVHFHFHFCFILFWF